MISSNKFCRTSSVWETSCSMAILTSTQSDDKLRAWFQGKVPIGQPSYNYASFDFLWHIIGVSLSEPHTSVTALLDACVCMYVCLWPYTENLNERTDFKFAHVLKQIHVRWTNSTPMKARLRTMTDKGRLLTDGTVKSRTVVAFASGKSMHNDTHKRQRFSSWLYCEVQSKRVCSVVASMTGEMAARSFTYHAHGTADSNKSCCYSLFVCHDKTLDQQCMLAQARPPDDHKSSY